MRLVAALEIKLNTGHTVAGGALTAARYPASETMTETGHQAYWKVQNLKGGGVYFSKYN
jgi:hypothetical protein